jgi:hypothetical protein
VSRVFRPQSAASKRRKLLQYLKSAVIASKGKTLDEYENRDLAAFICQVLEDIAESVKATASAWEKRGYWVKADQFMAQWSWIETSFRQATGALECGELQPQSVISQQLEDHLEDIKLSSRMRNQKPWKGAWREVEERDGDEEH